MAGVALQYAIRAGYSPKTAYRIGAELLQKTSVAAALAECARVGVRKLPRTVDTGVDTVPALAG
ncbi:terminase small subunit [Burkholderia multivorans]|nr:terminase small subunit [Burkholderia multivorans]MCA7956406.1 terminase small subunit [Burkholderia multivorans]MCA8484783.1 terminase small subunit [Burkholderia multivorans]MDN7593306.1 terminase small subunit [Burkholderia multivorans]